MRTSLLLCAILLRAGASAQFGSEKKSPEQQNEQEGEMPDYGISFVHGM